MNNFLICMGFAMGGLLGFLLTFYLILCFISWLGEIFEKTTWRWKK